MSTHEPATATRISTAWLASSERRCLRWMAARMPPSITSDHLTVLALVAMAMTGLSYGMARYTPLALVAACVWLAVNWFGDSLDGTLARVRDCQRPRYGFYVDHVVDAFGVLFLLGGLALSGHMHPLVAASLLCAYFLLSIEVYLAASALGEFRMSYWKLGPTELRMVLCLGNLTLLVHPNAVLFGQTYRLFDIGGLIAAALMVGTAIVSVARNTRRLYRLEPLPNPESQVPNPESAML